MKLSEYLKNHKMTHKQLAEKVGVSPVQITRIVNGTRNPSTLLVSIIEEETSGQVTLKDLVNPDIPSRLNRKRKPKTE